MNNNQKQGLLSVLAGFAIIILLAGIFLKNVPFMDALFVATSLWILVGVGAKFLGVRRNGRIVQNAGWRMGLVGLISSIGLIILLADVAFNFVDFKTAIFVTIVFWIASGILAEFLKVSRKNKYYDQNPNRYASGYFRHYPQANPYPPDITSPPVATNPPTAPKPYLKSNYNTDRPAKNFCPKCGSSMQIEDTFCSNCGSSMHI